MVHTTIIIPSLIAVSVVNKYSICNTKSLPFFFLFVLACLVGLFVLLLLLTYLFLFPRKNNVDHDLLSYSSFFTVLLLAR